MPFWYETLPNVAAGAGAVQRHFASWNVCGCPGLQMQDTPVSRILLFSRIFSHGPQFLAAVLAEREFWAVLQHMMRAVNRSDAIVLQNDWSCVTARKAWGDAPRTA